MDNKNKLTESASGLQGSSSLQAMPPSLLPHRSCSSQNCSSRTARRSATGLLTSIFRGVRSVSNQRRRSGSRGCADHCSTCICSNSKPMKLRHSVTQSTPPISAACCEHSSCAERVSDGCYYYYYYSDPKAAPTVATRTSTSDYPPRSPFSLSSSASLSLSADTVAPFPPPVGGTPQTSYPKIAGFKLLLPIPIRRTISEGPRGPQLSSGTEYKTEALNGLGLTPAADEYASTMLEGLTQDGSTVLEDVDSNASMSDTCEELMTIWSDVSGGFNQDSLVSTNAKEGISEPRPCPHPQKGRPHLLASNAIFQPPHPSHRLSSLTSAAQALQS